MWKWYASYENFSLSLTWESSTWRYCRLYPGRTVTSLLISCNARSTEETIWEVSRVGALLTTREKYTGWSPSAADTKVRHDTVTAKKAVIPNFREYFIAEESWREPAVCQHTVSHPFFNCGCMKHQPRPLHTWHDIAQYDVTRLSCISNSLYWA